IATNVWDGCIDFGTISPVVGNSYTTASVGNCQTNAYATGASFQSGGTISALTQCYGNCGSPAVTLANTNSTHIINFNQSIGLFQTGGQIPTVISQESSLGNSKMALYAFVTGNTIIIGPGPSGLGPGCQTVTCGIVALWIALGGDTAAGLGAFLIVLGLITGF